MTELQQTKGSVKVFGQVVGLQNENTYREGKTKNGEGQPYRSASLTVKTSPNNVIYNLDLFGQIPNKKVKVFSNKKNDKQTLEIDFDEEGKNIPEGFTPFGFGSVRTSFQKDANGKASQKNYFNYNGVKKIKETLKDGDSVWVNGEFKIETYQSNGEDKSTVKYSVQSIGFLKDAVDFTAEGFKEVASFEQEFVVVYANVDKEAKKLYITGRLINFDKSWKDTVFVIDANTYGTLAGNAAKKLKFGDIIKTQGFIRNGTVVEEIEETPALDWGGEAPEGQGKKFNRNKISELQITNITEHKAKVYKEEDFIVSTTDPFGNNGSSNSKDVDPFGDAGSIQNTSKGPFDD